MMIRAAVLLLALSASSASAQMPVGCPTWRTWTNCPANNSAAEECADLCMAYCVRGDGGLNSGCASGCYTGTDCEGSVCKCYSFQRSLSAVIRTAELAAETLARECFFMLARNWSIGWLVSVSLFFSVCGKLHRSQHAKKSLQWIYGSFLALSFCGTGVSARTHKKKRRKKNESARARKGKAFHDDDCTKGPGLGVHDRCKDFDQHASTSIGYDSPQQDWLINTPLLAPYFFLIIFFSWILIRSRTRLHRRTRQRNLVTFGVLGAFGFVCSWTIIDGSGASKVTTSYRPQEHAKTSNHTLCVLVRTYAEHARQLVLQEHLNNWAALAAGTHLSSQDSIQRVSVFVSNTHTEQSQQHDAEIQKAIHHTETLLAQRSEIPVAFTFLPIPDGMIPDKKKYGYDVTNFMLNHVLYDTKETCDWLLVTNGDNRYNAGLLKEINKHIRKRKNQDDVISFHFVSRYESRDGIPNTVKNGKFSMGGIDLGAAVFKRRVVTELCGPIQFEKPKKKPWRSADGVFFEVVVHKCGANASNIPQVLFFHQ